MRLTVVALLLFVSMATGVLPATAAGPAPTATPSGGAAPVMLKGTVPTAALKGAADLGPIASNAAVPLTIALAVQQPAALKALIVAQQTRTSPLYRRYLTTSQFAARFGATKAQITAATNFLKAHEITVTTVAPNHLQLAASGSAAQVEQAFGVKLHQFKQANGTTFRAPLQNPSVPASLQGVVQAVIGLDTVAAAHPNVVQGKPAAATPSTGVGALTPSDIRQAYDLGPAYTSGINGSGQTLGLFELDGYTASDVTGYEQRFSLPNVPLQNVLIDGFDGNPTSVDGAGEVTLDIELQMAVAPNVNTIMVYEGPNSDQGVIDTYARLANDNQATTISTSWGLCEEYGSTSVFATEDAIFQQMAAQGQTIFAASGDAGAYCDGYYLGIQNPSDDPYMTAVGGTSLSLSDNGAYAGEDVWGDSDYCIPGDGSTGGLSTVFSQPSWQTGPGVQNQYSNGMREVPDVSLDGDPCTGYEIVFQGGVIDDYGGTSCAAPIWAAWAALANQEAGRTENSRIGFVSPELYTLLNNPEQYNADFNDVRVGDNLYYPATPSYDLATGIGSFIGWNLLKAVADTPPVSISGVTDPSQIPNQQVDDFSANADGTTPTSFSGGGFSSSVARGGAPARGAAKAGSYKGPAPMDAGTDFIVVVGNEWGTWNPPTPGTHLLYVPYDSALTISFSTPTLGVVMKAGSNRATPSAITVQAFDSKGNELGSYQESINGSANASYLGLLSSTPNIAKVTISADGNADGFAFTDLTWAAATPAVNGDYHPLAPTRILDTRPGSQVGAYNTPFTTGLTRVVAVAGVPGTGVAAVALNVAVTDTATQGYLTLYPCDQERPLASTINWAAGETIAHLAIVPVSGAGAVCVYNALGSTDVVLDLEGWFDTSGAALAGHYQPLAPARILDTRPGSQVGAYNTPFTSGTTRLVQVTGRGNVPSSGVSAVIMNVAVTDTTADGYLTFWPAGQAQPVAANLNWLAGETIGNRVAAPVGANGEVAVYNPSGNVDVILDVNGWFSDGTAWASSVYTPLPPTRLLDTRPGSQVGPYRTPFGSGQTRAVPTVGQVGVPTGATAVVLNATVTDTSTQGYLTLYPTGIPQPVISDLNWATGKTIGNLTVVQVGPDGNINAYNALGNTDLIFDVQGYFH